ncbi:MAG: hypothetical protein Q8R63_08340 [Ramlibacter sp.]|nr:hypothetical protein [Ramlibacter sp.]
MRGFAALSEGIGRSMLRRETAPTSVTPESDPARDVEMRLSSCDEGHLCDIDRKIVPSAASWQQTGRGPWVFRINRAVPLGRALAPTYNEKPS